MRWILFLSVIIFLTGFRQTPTVPPLRSKTISTGERLDYRMYLGFFTVGKGVTTVDNKIHVKNEHSCFKVDAFMQTLGLATWISKVDDNWGAYIDTGKLVTHESYRKLKEGNYRLNEVISYDHEQAQATVNVADKQTGKFGKPKTYPIPKEVRDIVAGFMYLRIIDFSKYKLKDTLTVSGFFEDKSYHFKIIYFGKETVEMDFGRVPCYKLIPIMPDNQLFRGKNSITAWISADDNQVPVKVDAKMFIGHAGTELVSFRGLKNQFKIVPK
ncbi:MAG: DUF3108 domain-containing protein [Bacteroidetes bacterium]|nr:DUF3108 domain-containing protein [Bacteroidota bacterium]